MQIYFKSRTEQRAFKQSATATAKKVDNGTTASAGKRWALELQPTHRVPVK